MMSDNDNPFERMAEIARAHQLLLGMLPEFRDVLRDLLRRWIAGLSPEVADAAIVELFAEVQACDDMVMWDAGYRRAGYRPIE
jgi:uncharacterized Zn finger protein